MKTNPRRSFLFLCRYDFLYGFRVDFLSGRDRLANWCELAGSDESTTTISLSTRPTSHHVLRELLEGG